VGREPRWYYRRRWWSLFTVESGISDGSNELVRIKTILGSCHAIDMVHVKKCGSILESKYLYVPNSRTIKTRLRPFHAQKIMRALLFLSRCHNIIIISPSNQHGG
jgi:hypothetical protein